MTVGMNMMNQMFRDFKVAEDVKKMMELRRFEVEFEIYGTVYWKNGCRHYLISKKEEIIYQQILELEIEDCYPLPMQIWTERLLVPAGAENDIETLIKLHFAKDLKKKYPSWLWEKISTITKNFENDDGKEILDNMKENMEGRFQADQLQIFKSLLLKLYLRKNITRMAFEKYFNWLREEEQEMIDNITSKDIFEKTFFGIAYKIGEGNIQYVINASKQVIFAKINKLEQNKNVVISPIFQKKYWYNYDYRLEDVRKDFKALLEKLYNIEYFIQLEKIQKLLVVVDLGEYNKVQESLKNNIILQNVWRKLGFQWGIINNMGKL